MARKARDYKAEYARSKARAKAAGYQSEREYRAVRKSLKLPPRTSPIPRQVLTTQSPNAIKQATAESKRIARIRRESRQWSTAHSHRASSRYMKTMTDDQARQYHTAFVLSPNPDTKMGKQLKLKRMHDYMVPDIMDETEWQSKYPAMT